MPPPLPPALVRSILSRATWSFTLSNSCVRASLHRFHQHTRHVSSFYSKTDKHPKARGRNAHLSLPPLPPITPVDPTAPPPFLDSELIGTPTEADTAAALNTNPFSRIPHLPPVNDMLNAALARANKHRITQSLRAAATASAATPQRSRSKRAGGGSSASSAVARNTYKVHQLALQQLEAVVTAITVPLTAFLAAFPPLSRLHPFDRAVMRLALEGSEAEYVQRLRDGRRLVQSLKHKHEQATKQLHTAHISRRLTPTADDHLSSLLDPPAVPVGRDVESLLAYHRRVLLHSVVMSASTIGMLQQLAVRLSSTPLISTQPPPPFTVLLLGLPNVGKSSLLRALSSGRAEVQDYAFTTRGLKIGHLLMEEEEGEEDEVKELVQLAQRRLAREAEVREGRSKSSSTSRSRRHARLSDDEDNRAVRLREQRKVQSEQLQSVQQQQRAHSALLHSLHSSSPLLPIQLLDTPGLLPRPDGQRKAMELLSLTTLHCLDVHCVLFVMDDTGRGGWSMDDQWTVRRELRQRYHSCVVAGEVGWLDVYSKADVADKWQLPPVDPNEADEADAVYDEEERVQRQSERAEYRRLYGGTAASEQAEAGEAVGVVRVSVEDDGSILALQRAMKRQVRQQWRRMREQRGEVVESVEDEFTRMYGQPPTQQRSEEEGPRTSTQQQRTSM